MESRKSRHAAGKRKARRRLGIGDALLRLFSGLVFAALVLALVWWLPFHGGFRRLTGYLDRISAAAASNLSNTAVSDSGKNALSGAALGGNQTSEASHSIGQNGDNPAPSSAGKASVGNQAVSNQGRLYDLYMTDAFKGWLFSASGLFHTTDGGAHWQKVRSNDYPQSDGYLFSWVLDERHIWIGVRQADKAKLYATSDGGQSWKVESLPDGGTPEAAYFDTADQGRLLLRGSGKEVLYATHNGGGTWKQEGAGDRADARSQFLAGLFPSQETVLKDTLNVEVRTIDGPEGSLKVASVQYLDKTLGWAIPAHTNGESPDRLSPVLITGDGGKTWHSAASTDDRKELTEAEQNLAARAKEIKYYASPEAAQAAMQADWTLLPDKVGQGDVLMVRHNGPAQVNWQGRTYTLEKFGNGYYTYLPVNIATKPGEYPIGGAVLTVEKRNFKTDRIKVSKQLESIEQNHTRINADQKKIDEARSHSAHAFLFPPDSTFMQPVQGRISTPFGYTRYVNGRYDGSHTAIDIAAPEGTPVKAANDGVVVMAQRLYLTGNSVYIDHGMDLYSQYIHMSKLLVKPGEKVKKGQVIGLVGMTGFATGPHLHFTFWAHNRPVNPNVFFGTTPFHWFKPRSAQHLK